MRPAAWQRLDHLQPLLAGMLAALGLMTVYSAHADWVRQLVWLVLGGIAYAAVAAFDYRRLQALAPWIYVSMLALLLAVRLFGRAALGAQRWLSLGGFPLEPSELSKLMLVVVLGAYLSRQQTLSWRAFLGALGLVAPAAALILIQPDLGTTIVVLAVLVGMLFLGGARIAQLGSLVACTVVMIPLLPPAGGGGVRDDVRPGGRERRHEHRPTPDRGHPAAADLVRRLGYAHDPGRAGFGAVGCAPPAAAPPSRSDRLVR